MIRGVLFDMDGVLVNSEAFICRAAIEMFFEKGLNVDEKDFRPFVGMGENIYLGGVAEKYNLTIDINESKARTYEIYEKLSAGKLDPLPGALEFIELCRSKGLKLALATSTDRVKMEISLREIGLSPQSFNSTVDGLEIERKKPFPDIYIKAASNLGLMPDDCLVVEDAVSGVNAAVVAGCRCLAVTTTFSKDKLTGADWICDTLLNVPEDALNW